MPAPTLVAVVPPPPRPSPTHNVFRHVCKSRPSQSPSQVHQCPQHVTLPPCSPNKIARTHMLLTAPRSPLQHALTPDGHTDTLLPPLARVPVVFSYPPPPLSTHGVFKHILSSHPARSPSGALLQKASTQVKGPCMNNC